MYGKLTDNMEFLITLFTLAILKVFELTFALIKWSFKAAWRVITWPFRLITFGRKPAKKKTARKECNNSIDRAIDHLTNNPQKLDFEDMFWLDELIGDDDR